MLWMRQVCPHLNIPWSTNSGYCFTEKLSVAEVRKTLLLNELSDDRNEHNTTEDGPTAFISLGMEIEDDQ